MFQELAGKATEALGKAYLLTGLLPAGLTVLGAWCLWAGPTSLIGTTNVLLSADKTVQLTWFGLGIFALSFAFMVTRRVVVSFLEELPGRVLKPLRDKLICAALRTRKALEEDVSILETEYTAVRWFLENRIEKMFVPAVVPRSPWSAVIGQSEAAISVAHKLSREHPTGPASLSSADVGNLRSGLLMLTVFLADQPDFPAATQAIKAWKQWASFHPIAAKRILCLVLDVIQREISVTRSRLMRFPQPLWIKPTMLGNRFSVLEDYADRRYKISTSLLWEHVWWVLPEKDRAEISDVQVLVESFTSLTLTFGVLAGVGAILGASKLPLIQLASLSPPIGAGELVIVTVIYALLASASFHLALIPAETFATKVMSLIDIHRLTMLRVVGFGPKTVRDELSLLAELNDFWIHGAARDPTHRLGCSDDAKDPDAKKAVP